MKSFRTFAMLLKLAWQAQARYLLCLLLLTILGGIVPSLILWSQATLVDRLTQAAAGQPLTQASFLSRDFLLHDLPNTGLVSLLLLFGGLYILDKIIGLTRESLERIYQLRFSDHLRLLITKKAASLDLATFENPDFNNQLKQVSEQAGYRPYGLVSQSMMILSSLSGLISLIAVSLHYFWIIPLLVSSSFLMFCINVYFSRQQFQLTLTNTPKQRRAQYYQTILTLDIFAKEVRLLSLQNYFFLIYRTVIASIYGKEKTLVKRQFLSVGVAQAFFALLPIGLIVYGVYQVLQQKLSLGGFVLFISVLLSVQGVTLQLMNSFSKLSEHFMFGDMILKFFTEQPSVERLRNASQLVHASPSLEFANISFTYPDQEKATLNELSFRVAPGEKVALVGLNGAGKTTIVKLLAGLYETKHGQILLGGEDIRKLERETLRKHLSIMFQDFNIYHFPLKTNVVLGNTARFADQSWLETVAARTGLDGLVSKMPEGYDTVLDRFIDVGQPLSGGQRQIVALSRALFRNASILVLDEPTAAMDAVAEEHFFEDLLSHPHNEQQTILFISHRFSTIRRATRIIVLEKGTIAEEGSHDELIRRGGLYAQMYTAQARFFADQLT